MNSDSKTDAGSGAEFKSLRDKNGGDGFLKAYLSFNLGIFFICPFILSKAAWVVKHNIKDLDLEISEAGRSFFSMFADFTTNPAKIVIWAVLILLLTVFIIKTAEKDREKGIRTAMALVSSLQSLGVLIIFLLLMYAADSFLII